MLTQGQISTASAAPRRRPRAGLALVRMLAAIGLLLALSGCVSTQVRTVKDEAGKPIPVNGSIVLVEPDIELYELGAGGMEEPRKAWTEAAKRLYPEAARQVLQRQGLAVRPDFNLPDGTSADDRIRQLQLLNQAVSISILQHGGGPGARLRNKHGKFDWSLGPGVAELRKATGADYGLFTYIRDSYASGGRVAMRIIGFVLLGGDMGGGQQVGLASLVDLRTGQVVWHNLLLDQTGDLRDARGANETAADLLKGIRGANPPPPPGAAR